MISVGHKHFIESNYIIEILKASDSRADRITHTAAEGGMLINASGGRRVRSIIKLKGKLIVLSALRADTIKSRLGDIILSSTPGKNDPVSRNNEDIDANDSQPSKFDERRIEADRRRFSYTSYVPERRSGIKRRRKERQ